MNIKQDLKLKEIRYLKPKKFKDFRGEIWTSWEKIF